MTQRKIAYWVIPPQADAEFVANMEHVPETHEKPYDPAIPVVTMDEQPGQRVHETRRPIPATQRPPRRVDYEYERAGTASIFMFSEPLSGWRQASARERRTKADWAKEVAELLEGRYAACEKVLLVCDHLNTHTHGSFYEVFEPSRARALARRLGFCYTPKYGPRSLVEHRGKRTELPDASMPPRPPHRRVSDIARRSRGVIHQRQPHPTRCRLANENR